MRRPAICCSSTAEADSPRTAGNTWCCCRRGSTPPGPTCSPIRVSLGGHRDRQRFHLGGKRRAPHALVQRSGPRDPTGEAFYIRDERRGGSGRPRPAPRGADALRGEARAGLLAVFAPGAGPGFRDDHLRLRHGPVDVFTVISVRNLGPAAAGSSRGYCEWVLGDLRERYAMNVVSRLDPADRGAGPQQDQP